MDSGNHKTRKVHRLHLKYVLILQTSLTDRRLYRFEESKFDQTYVNQTSSVKIY
jgi:hypothetical protein